MKRFSPNPNGLGMYLKKNFGSVDFDWDAEPPMITLSVRDEAGNQVLAKNVSMDELRFPDFEGAAPAACVDESHLH